MRGSDNRAGELFSDVNLEKRVPDQASCVWSACCDEVLAAFYNGHTTFAFEAKADAHVEWRRYAMIQEGSIAPGIARPSN